MKVDDLDTNEKRLNSHQICSRSLRAHVISASIASQYQSLGHNSDHHSQNPGRSRRNVSTLASSDLVDRSTVPGLMPTNC